MQYTRWLHRTLIAGILITGLIVVGARLGGLHWFGDILALVVDYALLATLIIDLRLGSGA